MTAVTENYLKRVAPGQEKEFLGSLTGSKNTDVDQNPELTLLVDAYKSADSEKQRIMILSALDPKNYSKEQLMKIFDCTRYKVDAARNWRKDLGLLHEKMKVNFTRRKLDMDNAKHFLEFLFTSGLMQDIAYGSTTLVYSNGQKQALPKSILKMTKNHTIETYKKYCHEMNLTVKISDNSLWSILNEIKPGQRHALAGLDKVTASGLKAFDVLHETIKKLSISSVTVKELDVSLEKSKQYLKTAFSRHCSDLSEMSTHCISDGLFNPKDADFQGSTCPDHPNVCIDCMELIRTLETISEANNKTPLKELKEELQYDRV